MIKLKKILLEVLHNNSFTKKLNELGSSHASERNDGNWEEIFNNMKPSDTTINELFGWWLEVYSAMASKLLSFSKQIDLGYKLNQFESDIQKIISATRTCMDKIALLSPSVFAKMKKDEAFLLNDIKDELIEELQELLTKKFSQQESSDISEKLRQIADDYQRISENLLVLSWDYTEDESELGYADTDSAMAKKKLQPKDIAALNYSIPPTQPETPWVTTKMFRDRHDDLGHAALEEETRNKIKQGKSLIDIYNWLLNTQAYEGPAADTYMIIVLNYESQLVPFDKMVEFGKAIDKLPN
jgi:hypothetical protein